MNYMSYGKERNLSVMFSKYISVKKERSAWEKPYTFSLFILFIQYPDAVLTHEGSTAEFFHEVANYLKLDRLSCMIFKS
jgi:hypothetical protein